MIDLEGRLRRIAAAVTAAIAAERGTDDATLRATWTDDMAVALANYTADRAGYLDQLDFDLQEALATIAGYIDTEVGAITPAGPTNDQMETARDAIITEVDANETKIDDLDGDLGTHAAALTNHESAQSTHRTALTNHNTALTNHESSQATHRAMLTDIHDTDLPAVKTVADAIAVLTDTKVMGKPQIKIITDDFDSTSAGTYALVTAVDQDVIIESITFYCKRDLSGDAFSGLSFQTDDATPQVLISQAEGAKANLTAESQLYKVCAILLKQGTYIEFTVYDDDIASVESLVDIVITYKAVVSGGYIG